jgi:hypothetical protein
MSKVIVYSDDDEYGHDDEANFGRGVRSRGFRNRRDCSTHVATAITTP